jgi:DNA-directed RNA polymerase subunit RPC12/RpoP
MGTCSFGCGQMGIHQLRNGRACCAPSHNACPAVVGRRVASRASKAPDWFTDVECSCFDCSKPFLRRRDLVEMTAREGKPLRCKSCSRRAAGKTRWERLPAELKVAHVEKMRGGVHTYQEALTPEERSERGRAAGRHNTAFAVHRQWESIRNNPEVFQELRDRRSRGVKAIWDQYTPEERIARIQKMLGGVTGRLSRRMPSSLQFAALV